MNRLIDSLVLNSMTQVSRIPLDKDIENEMLNQFWKFISGISDPNAVSDFFSDFLTETEKLMLAKRFAVAILLTRGKKPIEIRNSLNVTFSTIGSVSAWLKYSRPNTKKVLKSLSNKKGIEVILNKIDEFLDKLPPRYGTNWTEAGKQKFRQAQARSVKSILR